MHQERHQVRRQKGRRRGQRRGKSGKDRPREIPSPMPEPTGRPESTRYRGTIKWFSFKKGYGFIRPGRGGSDVFLHFTSFIRAQRNSPLIQEGAQVEFEIELQKKGPKAVRTEILN